MSDPLPFSRRQFGGLREGPRLLVTAGIHGDEFLPMLAVDHLVRRFESDRALAEGLRGTLVLVSIANPPAFRRGHRCGEDGLDLARTFPGNEDGSPTERLAHHLNREIQCADSYVDLHTGGTELCVWPLAGYVLHPDKTILERQRELARAFLLPFLWGTSAELPGRSLSAARDAGVPAIYVEYLGGHRERAEIFDGEAGRVDDAHPLVAGCLNVMRHLGMIEGGAKELPQETVEDWRSGSGHMQVSCPAPATGFFRPAARLGEIVSPGDLIGEVDSGAGSSPHRILAQQSGRLIVLREFPRINEGDAVAVIAESFDQP